MNINNIKTKPIKTDRNHPAIKAYSEAVERGKKSQYIIPTDNGWEVQNGVSKKSRKIFKTQSEAIKNARKVAKNNKSSIFIHGRDGMIRDRRDY